MSYFHALTFSKWCRHMCFRARKVFLEHEELNKWYDLYFCLDLPSACWMKMEVFHPQEKSLNFGGVRVLQIFGRHVPLAHQNPYQFPEIRAFGRIMILCPRLATKTPTLPLTEHANPLPRLNSKIYTPCS